MAGCEPMSFQGITPEVFESISKQLAQKGFVLSGPRGQVKGPFGIVIEYDWNEQNRTITLQVVEKSFFVPCSQIKEQIQSAFEKYVA